MSPQPRQLLTENALPTDPTPTLPTPTLTPFSTTQTPIFHYVNPGTLLKPRNVRLSDLAYEALQREWSRIRSGRQGTRGRRGRPASVEAAFWALFHDAQEHRAYLAKPRARRADDPRPRMARAACQLPRDRLAKYPSARGAFLSQWPKDGEAAIRRRIATAHEVGIVHIGKVEDGRLQVFLPYTYTLTELPTAGFASTAFWQKSP